MESSFSLMSSTVGMVLLTVVKASCTVVGSLTSCSPLKLGISKVGTVSLRFRNEGIIELIPFTAVAIALFAD